MDTKECLEHCSQVTYGASKFALSIYECFREMGYNDTILQEIEAKYGKRGKVGDLEESQNVTNDQFVREWIEKKIAEVRSKYQVPHLDDLLYTLQGDQVVPTSIKASDLLMELGFRADMAERLAYYTTEAAEEMGMSPEGLLRDQMEVILMKQFVCEHCRDPFLPRCCRTVEGVMPVGDKEATQPEATQPNSPNQ
jgi:hypothetical protein